jgi:hypothetical protein
VGTTARFPANEGSDHVLVMLQGDFEQLLIVRIDEDFQFKGKLIDRERLREGGGKFLKARLRDGEEQG